MCSMKIFLKDFRKYSTFTRKFPLDPKHVDEVPIADYGKSKICYNRVYAWGNTKTGALGLSCIKSNESFDLIHDFHFPKRLTFAEKHHISKVACGFGFTLFYVEQENKLYGCGLNSDSQIGHHEVRHNKPLSIIFSPQVISLPCNSKLNVIKLSAGRAHSAVLSNEGLFLFGNNAYGQCGRAQINEEDYTKSNYIHFISNVEGEKIIDVECGQDHTLIITKNGSVYSCGWGADGQTGLGHFNNCTSLSKVGGDIENEKIIKLSSRSDFVMALNDRGDVFGWGNTEYGQLTTSDNVQQLSFPTYIKTLKPLGKVVDIAAGGSSCLALNENRDLFAWGFGILGAGPEVQQSFKPVRIPETLFGKNAFSPDSRIEAIQCGVSHSVAITNYGDIFLWGRNRNGCLGLGNDKDQYFPLKVCIGAAVKKVSCGIDHTVAVCQPFI